MGAGSVNSEEYSIRSLGMSVLSGALSFPSSSPLHDILQRKGQWLQTGTGWWAIYCSTNYYRWICGLGTNRTSTLTWNNVPFFWSINWNNECLFQHARKWFQLASENKGLFWQFWNVADSNFPLSTLKNGILAGASGIIETASNWLWSPLIDPRFHLQIERDV